MPSVLAQLQRVVGRDGAPAQQPGGTILAVQGVTARYGSTLAIRGINLEVGPGEIVAILGANGAGKTTTLKTIVGLLHAVEGRLLFDGKDITKRAPERIVELGISMTPEGRQVFGSLTVDENLRLGAGLAPQSEVSHRREEVLDLFPVLVKKGDVFAGLLSGGEQQQLAIARSLMSDPRLLLLDEPSLGLAPIIVERVFALIEQLRARGTTLVIAEQNVDKALEVADRAYVFSTGRIELEGPASELRQNADIEAAYLGLGVRDGE